MHYTSQNVTFRHLSLFNHSAVATAHPFPRLRSAARPQRHDCPLPAGRQRGHLRRRSSTDSEGERACAACFASFSLRSNCPTETCHSHVGAKGPHGSGREATVQSLSLTPGELNSPGRKRWRDFICVCHMRLLVRSPRWAQYLARLYRSNCGKRCNE